MVTTTTQKAGLLCHGCNRRVPMVMKTSDGKYKCFDCAERAGDKPVIKPVDD